MDVREYCPQKVVTAEKAISKIRRGSRVFVGTGCGEPQHLIRTMVEDMSMQDIMIYQMLSSTLSDYVNDEMFLRRFSLKLFFISRSMRKAAFEGKIDYIPTYLSQIPTLFFSKRIGLDVALIQVSPPDKFGYCSLGVSVDITRSGMENAKLVIAQINPNMPKTWGDSFVHIDEIDYIVLHEEDIVEMSSVPKDNEVTRRIGMYVSQVVEDESTIQVGFGHLPNTILPYLYKKKDLGVHTQVITDGLLPLLEKKAITNKKKTLIPGRVVASLCMGSRKLYEYVHNNPDVLFPVLRLRQRPHRHRPERQLHLHQLGPRDRPDRTGLFGLHGQPLLQRHRRPGRFPPGGGHVQRRLFHCRPPLHRPERKNFPDRPQSERGGRRRDDPRRRRYRHHRIRHRRAPGEEHLPAGHGADPDRPPQIPGGACRIGQEQAIHLLGPTCRPPRRTSSSSRATRPPWS